MDEVAPSLVDRTDVAALDAWVASKSGDEALTHLVHQAWQQMSAYRDGAMPAHDARHAMFQVPFAAMEHMLAEGYTGHRQLGVLGALLHDHGRWAEERLFGGPGDSAVHSRMSFVLARELIRPLSLPPALQDHILLAVLGHTKGAKPEDPAIYKVTVSADRDQLYGHEIILRLVHHPRQPDGTMGHLVDDSQGQSVVSRLWHYWRNRLPGPLFANDERVARLRLQLEAVLLRAEGLPMLEKRWDALHLDEQLRVVLRTRAHQAQTTSPRDCEPLPCVLSKFLDAPHLAPAPHYRAEVLAKARGLSTDDAQRLASALSFSLYQRERCDSGWALRLADHQHRFRAGPRWLQAMLEHLASEWVPLAVAA